MRAISERDLAVVIPLLAAKIRDLTQELRVSQAQGSGTDADIEDRMQIQEILEQYGSVLDSLRSEYEDGLAEGIRLPTFEDLTSRFQIEPSGR